MPKVEEKVGCVKEEKNLYGECAMAAKVKLSKRLVPVVVGYLFSQGDFFN